MNRPCLMDALKFASTKPTLCMLNNGEDALNRRDCQEKFI